MSSPLPLFPLNAVLVPGLVLPLHIFEPRYRDMVDELLANPVEEEREFGIIAVRDGREIERDGVSALYPVGTTAVLRQADRLEDGRFDIVATGNRRFRIIDIDPTEPLLRGTVDFLDDVSDPADAVLAAQVAGLFLAYRLALSGQIEGEVPPEAVDDLPDDPTVLGYLVTAAMVLPAAERQGLLAAATTADRLAAERRLLRRETGLIAALGAVPAIDLAAIDPSVN